MKRVVWVLAVPILMVMLGFFGCGAGAPTDTGSSDTGGVITPPTDATVPDAPTLASGEGGIAFYIDGGGNVVTSSDAATRAVSNRWNWSTADVVVHDDAETIVAGVLPSNPVTLTRGINQYASFSGLTAGSVLHVHVTLKAGAITVATGVSSPSVTIIAGRYVGVQVTLTSVGGLLIISGTDPDDGDSVAPDAIIGCIVSDPGAYQPNVELWIDDNGPSAPVLQGTSIDSWNPEWAVTGLALGACDFYFVVTSTSGASLTSGTYTVTVTDTGGLDVGILSLPSAGR